MNILKKYNVMLGSDPEILLTKTKHNHTMPFPIIGLLGYGKENPLFIDKTKYRTLQEDNVAIEYTTHPVSTKEEWLKEQSNMFKYTKNFVENLGLNISTKPALMYNPSVLESTQAKTFGCEKTFNAYKNDWNNAPPATGELRSAGGHVHISYDNPTQEVSLELIKILDILYVQDLGEMEMITHSKLRRNLYGLAGEVRIKSYGVEWRTPSNEWIFTAKKREMIYNMIKQAFEMFDNGYKVNQDRYTEQRLNSLLKGKVSSSQRTEAAERLLETIKRTKLCAA